MGSRKKIKANPQKSPIPAYRKLSINERIALKAYLFWFGRSRMNLLEFSKMQYRTTEFAEEKVRELVIDGQCLIIYNWKF